VRSSATAVRLGANLHHALLRRGGVEVAPLVGRERRDHVGVLRDLADPLERRALVSQVHDTPRVRVGDVDLPRARALRAADRDGHGSGEASAAAAELADRGRELGALRLKRERGDAVATAVGHVEHVVTGLEWRAAVGIRHVVRRVEAANLVERRESDLIEFGARLQDQHPVVARVGDVEATGFVHRETARLAQLAERGAGAVVRAQGLARLAEDQPVPGRIGHDGEGAGLDVGERVVHVHRAERDRRVRVREQIPTDLSAGDAACESVETQVRRDAGLVECAGQQRGGRRQHQAERQWQRSSHVRLLSSLAIMARIGSPNRSPGCLPSSCCC